MDQQTKAALKQDQFVDITTHGISWATENRRTVIVSSLVILGLILFVVAGFLFYSNRNQQASVDFGAAMAVYQSPVVASGQPVPPGMKTFATIGDRAKAAGPLFKATADKYSMTSVGKNARYFAGLTYMEAGENASAEATLKEVAGYWDSDLASLGKVALAQLYGQTGRSPQAIQLYSELAAKPTNTVPAGMAQLQLAKFYEGQGQPDAAKKIYAQLKDKDAKGPAGMIAAQKLNPQPAGMPAPPQ